MLELLAGALTGSGTAGPGPRPLVNGMLSIYMAGEFFHSDHDFAGEVRQYVDFVKTAKPVIPGQEVLLPGETERRNNEQRLAEGIPLPDNTWQAILSGAEQAGMSQAQIEQALG